MSLCKACDSLFSRSEVDQYKKYVFDHRASDLTNHLERSDEDQVCPFCTFLQLHFSNERRKQLEGGAHVCETLSEPGLEVDRADGVHFYSCSFEPFFDESIENVFRGMVWKEWNGRVLQESILNFFMVPNSLWRERIVSGIDPDSRNTDSSQSFDLVKRWIQECHSTHSKCNRQPATVKDSNRGWLPTRLLDVRSLANDSEGSIRLVLCSQLPKSVDYATLSYCWGSNPSFVELLTTNLSALQIGIPLVQLPRTFRDAVQVTRRLGYQFLWIDALCIVQDSQEDWLREALLMAKVYASSILNIAAAASGDAHGGLFRDREAGCLNGCDIPIAWDRMNASFSSNPVKKQIYHVFLNDPWVEMLSHSSLRTRGWAFQERLLSPRILHFAHDQIYWECCDHGACELYPEKDIFQIHSIVTHVRRPVKDLFTNLRPDGDIDLSLRIWDELVGAYSRTELSRSSDKLVALSGIAGQMAPVLKPENYMAGIWKQSLPESLLWIARPDALPAPQYRAPSWSWASLDGQIARKTDPELRVVAKVLASETTTNASPFGPVTGGSLVMKGFFCEDSPIFANYLSKCTRKGDACYWNWNSRGSTTVAMCLDTGKAGGGNLEVTVSQNLFLFPIKSDELSLGGTPTNSKGLNGRRRTEGLILEPVRCVNGRFRRVGHFTVTRRSTRSIWWNFGRCLMDCPYLGLGVLRDAIAHVVISLVRGQYSDKPLQEVLAKAKLHKQYYQDFDGGDQYTIEIV